MFLANNSSSLNITDLDIEFFYDYESIEVEPELDESAEDTGYYDVTVIYNDKIYYIIINGFGGIYLGENWV